MRRVLGALSALVLALGVAPRAVADVPTTTALPHMAPATGQVLVGGRARGPVKLAVAVPLGPKELSTAVVDLATRDFAQSPMFEVLDAKLFRPSAPSEGVGAIDPKPWRDIGAEGVVKAETSYRGGNVHLELRLFLVGAGASPVLARELDTAPTGIRAAIHAFDNEVVKTFTRAPGSFGTRLVFSATIEKGQKAIYTIDSDGEGLARLPASTSVALSPAIGPDGVYYAGYMSDGGYALFKVGAPAPVLRQQGLVFGVAFGAGKMGLVVAQNGTSDIFVGDASGRGLARITSGGLNTHPSIGPKGEVAYVSNRSGSPQIYVDGKLVTTRGSYNLAPAWCNDPDGAKILFMGRDGTTWDIFSVDPASGAIQRLTQDQGSNTYPACSPDGRTMAFFSTRDGGGLFVSDTRGQRVRKIASVSGESLRWE